MKKIFFFRSGLIVFVFMGATIIGFCQKLQKVSADSFYSFYTAINKKGVSPSEIALGYSKSGNSYDFMTLRSTLGTLNSIIAETADERLINEEILLINNLINSAQVSQNIPNNKYEFKDGYKGWIALKTNERNKGSQFLEVPLFESYSFFYITQFLYLIRKNKWIEKSSANKVWWKNTLSFIEKNEWKKWYERSYKIHNKYYRVFLRSRTHMGSHWAGIAMYLKEMTSNSDIKGECKKAQEQYDTLLKRNLKLNPTCQSAWVWNSTYDNTMGTDANATESSIIQDVSHGNHVVAYITAAYQLGDMCWRSEDIQSLCNTLKYIIYNKQTNTFADNVDGTKDPSRPGRGNFVEDGWIKLSKYDLEVANIFNLFSQNKFSKRYNPELQFQYN